jgi:hypothetical protein
MPKRKKKSKFSDDYGNGPTKYPLMSKIVVWAVVGALLASVGASLLF